jgi:mRNA-degrading endonuclease RelE of RelBE toxin-antitoxin system
MLTTMVIVETSVFTRRIGEFLADEEYRKLQGALADRPAAGRIISGSGGLRKVRWAPAGRGKRGGVRIIYYWAVAEEKLLMLLIYAKNERDDLSAEQLRILRGIIEEEYP